MKTSKKPTSKQSFTPRRKAIAAFVVMVGFLLVGLYYVAHKLVFYDNAANQSSVVQIRELIIRATENLKKDAPVDPKTGDIYFPESRLYLPNPKQSQSLTYGWVAAADSYPEELSVSLGEVPGITKLYGANNVEQLFEHVPYLQACSRGVKLVYQKYPADDEANQLKHTVTLADGKTLYIYVEKNCPELDETAELLQQVRQY